MGNSKEKSIKKQPVTFAWAMISALFVLGAGRCSSMQYEPDIGFLNSAQANSMEYMVRVDKLVCKDLEGFVGACTKRVKSNAAISLHHDSRPYPYRIDVRCTEATGIGFSMDVQAFKAWDYMISPEKFASLKSFTCMGEVFPFDRDNKLSALWQVRFLVVDSAYSVREVIYRSKNEMIFGKHAKYARLCSDKECRDVKEKPVVYVKGENVVRAYSESELLRFNYFGY